ncbi:MAG: arginase family protein [Candidatus Dormibacteraeota bacterium]|nr:arginase family protein [Candidatus Dormibacteraeota bacterium]
MDLTGLRPWAGLAGGSLERADVVVAGIPYDGSAVYRKGAAGAPARIRQLSAVMPPVTEDGRHLQGLAVHDLGDLDAGPDIESGHRAITERLAAIPAPQLLTVFGGDHCSAIPVVAAQAIRYPGLALLWIDAHPDLCDFSRGGAWTCGCALRRAIEVAGIEPRSAGIVGGRDYDMEELDYIRAQGMLLLGAPAMARDPEAAAASVAQWVAGRPLHLSFDIDVLDPAAAPGTEIPSSGGLTTRQALDFLAALAMSTHLVGLDLVEVAPNLDHNDITSLAALKVIFEFWGRAWKAPT